LGDVRPTQRIFLPGCATRRRTWGNVLVNQVENKNIIARRQAYLIKYTMKEKGVKREGPGPRNENKGGYWVGLGRMMVGRNAVDQGPSSKLVCCEERILFWKQLREDLTRSIRGIQAQNSRVSTVSKVGLRNIGKGRRETRPWTYRG